jgi:hypothetical protein
MPKKSIHGSSFLKGKFYLMDGNSFYRIGDEIGRTINGITSDEEFNIVNEIQELANSNDQLIQNRIKKYFHIPKNISLNPKNWIKKTISFVFEPKKSNTASEVDIKEFEKLNKYKELDKANLLSE